MRNGLLLVSLLLLSCAQPNAPASEPPKERDGTEGNARTAREPRPPVRLGLPAARVDEMRALGSEAATVAIVEFADYQCSYCRRFHFEMLPRIKRAYIDTGKLRYFYKDLPLRMHAQAFAASVAARCAGEQGKFWPMHERLYAEQAQLKQAPFLKFAGELGLDTAHFESCRKSTAARNAVNRDMIEARQLGVSATPTILLGRLEGNRVTVHRMATGSPKFEVIARELDALLEPDDKQKNGQDSQDRKQDYPEWHLLKQKKDGVIPAKAGIHSASSEVDTLHGFPLSRE